MFIINRLTIFLVALATMLWAAFVMAAETYPARPVRVIVPFPPGGTTDIVARVIGNKLSENLRQNFVIDNRGGAGGTIGTDLMAKAPPNGYTLLVFHVGLAYNAALYSKLPYDTLRDIAPVSLAGSTPSILVVTPSNPSKTVKDFLAAAKAAPGRLNFGSAGVGSSGHLAVALFQSVAGVRFTHVPYKGGGPALAATIGGEVQFMIETMPGAIPHVKAGKLRALGVSTAKRSGALPDLPTIAEAGVPGYDYLTWFGVFAPGGTSPAIVTRLNTAVNQVLAMADVKDNFSRQGLDPGGSTVADFRNRVQGDVAKWGKLIKAANIRAN